MNRKIGGKKDAVSDSTGLPLPLPGWKCPCGNRGTQRMMVRDTSAMLQQYEVEKREQTSWALEGRT